MKVIFSIIIFLLLTGCNDNQKMNSQQVTSIDTTVLNSQLKYPEMEVMLSPASREITDDWLAFLTAQSEIESFRTYTVKEVSSNATPIAEIMNNLRNTSPTQIKTHAVETRLSVLYTKARVLEFLSSKRNPDYVAIKKAAEELPVEFNNFKIQINELFLKTLEDLEEELDAFDVEDTTSRPLLRTIPAMREQI